MIIIITDIGVRSLWLNKVIALLPNAQRVSLDARNGFYIFNGEFCHRIQRNKYGQNLFKLLGLKC